MSYDPWEKARTTAALAQWARLKERSRSDEAATVTSLWIQARPRPCLKVQKVAGRWYLILGTVKAIPFDTQAAAHDVACRVGDLQRELYPWV
jgi:hypothetical protein